ncbi:iron complex outermembrane receptor protein [Kordia periserrulae]|uniref:Iron complex outermembrane receptor protein n=1 Tax=Kordia periserrulae TaxID=701523 RepID=A0A2T6BVB9_9FLAO|nr:TonB-dependent receptor [Kordia periserrulae]PTX60003.1 iron complex outermembrane receptor protein [Kordia periserrulae]
MKNLFAFLCLFVLSVSLQAQNFTLSGTVSDENGAPLTGATLVVKGASYGTTTDSDGKYALSVAQGNIAIICSFVGMKTETKTLTITENTVLNFTLKSSQESLDAVLISAVRVNADSPITYSNLEKEEIAERNLGQDIPVLMNFMPSVVTTSDAGAGVGYTGIRVRGSDATRVNVTINGIPYNDAESQGTFWVNMPDLASSTENIQLQRGVGTSTNGSGAFGASLSLLTDAVSEEANGEITNAFGSFNTRRHTVKFSTGKLADNFELAGRLSKIKSDGYIDRASSDLSAYFLQGSYVTETTLIKALTFGGHEITYQAWNGIDRQTLETNRTFNPSGEYTDENGNVRFYDNEVDNYRQDHYQLHWNEKISENWTTNLSLNYTQGRGYFEQYKEDEPFSTYGFDEITINGTTINETDVIRRRWLDNDFYAINANANYRKNNLDMDFGAFLGIYDGDHFGEVIWARFASDSEIRDRYYEGNGKKNDLSFFTKATVRVNDNVSLFGDVQVRNVTYKTSGLTSDQDPFNIDENYTFFNPKAGINYRVNDKNSLYFSYARANREPNRSDFENNNEVKPEQLDDFELGWRWNGENFTVNTNAYYMLYNDQLVLTGALDDTGTPLRTNSGRSYRLGLEIDASFKLSDKFSIRPNMAISTNKNIDFIASQDGSLVNLGNTNISFSPDFIAGNIMTYKPLHNFQVSLLSKYVGEQFMGNIDSEVSRLDSYFTNDLNFVYELKLNTFCESITFTGLINNIFDVEYVSNGYFFTYDDDFSNPGTVTTIEGAGFYPQATRNFLVGMTLKF